MNAWRQRAVRIGFAWLALIVLMLSSLASSYVSLGAGNLVAGLAIAATKSLIVLAVFMGLVRAPSLLRVVAAIGFFTLALLFTLSTLDEVTRTREPAAMQRPQEIHQETRK